ncbi:unnamed protein product [Paramecium sonneborni]|uniref:G domain-containing protein n=1 Tax=Paramecium sonneborni TaxID=65129 RepID=A0A8S1RC53_9CILI|nr:unnamed protein product [Paramecium sonneborni]
MILKKVRSFKKSFKSPHLFKNIGYICQMYLSNQLQLIYDEFGKQLKLLEKDLFILLQLPINIINMQQEISHKEKQFQENLYIILIKIKQILFQYIDNFENLSTQIYNVINEWQNNITNSLIEIKNDNLQIKEFLNNLTKENIKFNNNSQYFQYDFLLSKADIIVYNYFQNYNDKQKLISDLNQFDLLIISWLDCFKDNIVSSIAYLFKLDLLPQEQEQKKNQTSVFILGPTRVGKSTLLNIINNSLNMKIHETQHKSLVFDVKEVSEKFEISHGLNSLTDCLQYFQLKNTNLLFFDSPGFVDTQYEKRIINQIKIFLKLIIQNQVILMILIDGLELCVSKKNFSETIKLLNIFFGDDSFDKQNYLSIIIPVFTKLEENTMDVIKKKWDSEIMKNIQNNAEENMLKIIKNQIDKNRHIKIYQASHYQNNNLQDLKSKKKEKETEMMELIKLQQFEQFQEFGINIKNLQNQIDYLENNRNEIIYKVKFEEIQQLRNRIIDICQELKDEQIEKQIQIKFSLKLTADLQNHLDQVLILWKNIFQFILKNIENSLLNMTQTHFNFRTFLTSLDVLERNLQYFQKENRDQRLYRYYYFFFKFCIYTNNNLIIQDCFRLLYLVDIFDQLSGKKQYCYDIDSLLNHIYQQVIYLKKGFNKQLFNFDQIDMAKNQQIFKEFQNNYSSKK